MAPSWAATGGISDSPELDAINKRFYLVVEDGRPTGIAWLDIELLTEKRWSAHLTRKRFRQWVIDFWRYSWDPEQGGWKPISENVKLTEEVYRDLLGGRADFVDGSHPIALEMLPPEEQYWAECEFFPAPENDGVPPDPIY